MTPEQSNGNYPKVQIIQVAMKSKPSGPWKEIEGFITPVDIRRTDNTFPMKRLRIVNCMPTPMQKNTEVLVSVFECDRKLEDLETAISGNKNDARTNQLETLKRLREFLKDTISDFGKNFSEDTIWVIQHLVNLKISGPSKTLTEIYKIMSSDPGKAKALLEGLEKKIS